MAYAGVVFRCLRFHALLTFISALIGCAPPQLGDTDAALASLLRGGAAANGSPLEERARVLEMRLLGRLNRNQERLVRARQYVERFPDTPTAFELQRDLTARE